MLEGDCNWGMAIVISALKVLEPFPVHLQNLSKESTLEKSLWHIHRLTHNSKETEMEIMSEQTRRKVSQERLQQSSDNMWILYIGLHQVHVAFYSYLVNTTSSN